jgi:hypothetical protein
VPDQSAVLMPMPPGRVHRRHAYFLIGVPGVRSLSSLASFSNSPRSGGGRGGGLGCSLEGGDDVGGLFSLELAIGHPFVRRRVGYQHQRWNQQE